MRIVGPNCLGVMSPLTGLNATFAAGMALPGSVAFLSQSGALLTAILDWSLREQVGFSAFVSLGAMIDVGWGDLIDYLGDDPRTRAIVIYMESIGDARAFLSAAREVALSKPIIVIKAGRSEAASRAAASHTGALTGSDAVLDAAFRRSGVLRVTDIGDVFRLADVLGRQPRPQGPRLTIVTNAGGPGVLATDALVAGGGELAPLGAEARARLDAVLPAAWSHANPLDILGDADPGTVRDRAVAGGGGSGQRRPARHPHAARHDRSDAHRGGARQARARRRQAGPRELDGGRRRRGRGRHPESGRDPHLPVPGRRRAHLLSDVALRRQPAQSLRNARASSRRRPPSRGRAGDHRRRARRGPHLAR